MGFPVVTAIEQSDSPLELRVAIEVFDRLGGDGPFGVGLPRGVASGSLIGCGVMPGMCV